MSIESIMIVSVGGSATAFLFSLSWWLWRNAPAAAVAPQLPPAPPVAPAPPIAPPAPAWSPPAVEAPRRPVPELPRASEAAPADDATQAVSPTWPESARTRRTSRAPELAMVAARGEDLDSDQAKTMFFTKRPAPSVTQKASMRKAFDFGDGEEDAPLGRSDQVQTLPNRRATKRAAAARPAKPTKAPPQPPQVAAPRGTVPPPPQPPGSRR